MKEPSAVLIDSGPLIALADQGDAKHEECWKALRSIPRATTIFTVPHALMEVFYILAPVPSAIDAAFKLLKSLRVEFYEDVSLDRVQELIDKYNDLPMDFVDACIVAAAEEHQVNTIFTLDKRDFHVYRPRHVKSFHLLP